MKFSWKVTLATLCILVISFSAGSCLLISLSFRSALARETSLAQEEMQMLRISYEAVCAAKGVTLENIDTVGRRVQRTLEEDSYFKNRSFRVTTQSGAVIHAAQMPEGDRELLGGIDEGSAAYVIRRDEKTGLTAIHCAGTVSLPDGILYLETVRDISGPFTDRETHFRLYRWLLLAVVAVSGAVLLVLSSWLTKPIRTLGKAATRLAEGDYASRAEVTGRDEIGELAVSFNQMAGAIERNVQELEEAARRQEDFTGSFVHELKTPLTSIIGYADMLRSRELSEDMRFKAASYIFSEGKRLESLSLSLMNLLVVGHGGGDIHPVQMARLCQETAKAARPAMQAKGLELRVRVQEGTVSGDAALLQTLLMNLLDNARKASAGGSAVTLEGKPVPAGYKLTVTDQGRGIPAAELNKITEAFYMVDKSRSRAEGGAGLGLALCKQIVTFHNGAMRFSSREGQGTTVDVILGGAADAGKE